jgi:hypothetical protein
MQNKIQLGWAATSITPDKPVFLNGQIYYRISRYVHDPITATALAISSGDDQAIFLSADMAGISDKIIDTVRKAVHGFGGIQGDKISFSATHSHNSSFLPNINEDMLSKFAAPGSLPELDIPPDLLDGNEALKFICSRFVMVIKDAWDARQEGAVSFASDYAAIGFNRRPQFHLGKGLVESKMYGVCSRNNFLRFEGTVDHTIDMLYTWDRKGRLTGVLVDVPCPSQVMELHHFISADYWGYTRSAIRKKLGNVFVLSICGAAGDQTPLDLIRISKDNEEELEAWNAQAGEVFRNLDMSQECEEIAARIADAVVRGMEKGQKNIESRPIFKHILRDIILPIRQVSEENYLEAAAMVKEICGEFSASRRMMGKDLVRLFEPLGIMERWELQQSGDTTTIHSNILRLGDTALCTNPFELFVEYGLRIRARSRARQVFILQLTNGQGGYLPTDAALEGGSYSSKPASTLVGPRGGDLLTETIIREINRFWDQKSTTSS